MSAADPSRIAAIFRIERARLIASLARHLRGDLALAEDLAQDALVAALEVWPRQGVPDNPGGWLRTVAKRKSIDEIRRRRMSHRKYVLFGAEMNSYQEAPDMSRVDPEDPDDLLALIFAVCHPALEPRAACALALRLLAGLTVPEIARAYFSSEDAVARRITRAKTTLRNSAQAFEVPYGKQLESRLGTVLEILYLIFNEGYAANQGVDPVRPDLCGEATRLSRILVRRMPHHSEVWALLALMELQASRLHARMGPDGIALRLDEQDRALWDHHAILRGRAALARADALRASDAPYLLQAQIAACHARTGSDPTDWPRIAALYDRLVEIRPTAIVALNRAIAWSMAEGPEEGLVHLADLEAGGQLQSHAPLHAAIADCLYRSGRQGLAARRYRLAASLSLNEAQRGFLIAMAKLSEAEA
ncbi:RNA polymerase sigma factor [Paracoccus aestuariivivens]|uniref:Sigma-70 family RNA polymerase sigma factor n=1 Tax=Paracoccus aestuariivivens TaxID=1820333 RepID=A0A6L6JDN7_9RHOB|nr:sigma-70 family RNA polymerase sigma factor [Paracoccus aestuariivivens]MTH80100.1 sigma-70 family RNA polymerase sigma factor [Paracoccus aestuariivivens]